MKKYLTLFILITFSFNTEAQQTVTINGPTNVEVGIPYDYTFTFNPVYPQDYYGVATKTLLAATTSYHQKPKQAQIPLDALLTERFFYLNKKVSTQLLIAFINLLMGNIILQ